MLRKFPIFMTLAIALTLVVGGCSKKAPNTPAGSDTSASSSTSAATESDVGGNANAGATTSSALDSSALPVVYFGFNEYTLNSEDRDKLKAAAEHLKSSTAKLTVEGHCDERGSSEFNLALGERRAQSVKSYLQKLGVPSTIVSTISYGKERPADTGHSETSWSKNRRGELVVNR